MLHITPNCPAPLAALSGQRLDDYPGSPLSSSSRSGSTGNPQWLRFRRGGKTWWQPSTF